MEVLQKDITSTAKIWIYQSDKDLSEIKNGLENHLRGFVNSWMSHGDSLVANAWVEYNRFIIITVDESEHNASGCSIDSSVHFLKKIEKEYEISLFEKMNFAYMKSGELQIATAKEFGAAYSNGDINDETVVFDNLVKSYGDYLNHWKKPLKDSWHKRFV